MVAQVSEVSAFKSIDNEVFTTYVKAHHRNIWVLCHRLFETENAFDGDKSRLAAELLYAKLTTADNNKSRHAGVLAALRDLAKELD